MQTVCDDCLLDEKIPDPCALYESYLQRRKQMIRTVSDEFVENLEFNRLSSIYNFNSTIYQLEPTAKVGYIKAASHYAEVALPILSKIKN